MKKLAAVLIAAALAAVLFLAYRGYLAAERLRAIAASVEYRAFGLKLVLSAPQEGVKGLFRLQPYLEIPEVRLDASAWGAPAPLPLGRGRLKTGLWDRAGLRLVLDAGSSAGGQVEFDRLAFELGLPDRILGVRAEEISLPSQEPGKESLSLQEPWLQLGAGRGEVPLQMNLRFQSLAWERRAPEEKAERLRFGVTELGYALSDSEGEWKWRAHFRGQGLASETRRVQGQVKPWSLLSEGRAAKGAEPAWEQWRELWRKIPAFDWESLPDTIVALRPRIDRVEFHWGGWELRSGESWRTEAGPMEFMVHYLPHSEGYGWKLKGEAAGFGFGGPQRRLEAQALAFEEEIEYRGLRYETWLAWALRYYGELAASRRAGAGLTQDPAPLVLPYLAHLPDQLRGELKLGRLSYVAPDYRSEHRDGVMDFGAKAEGLHYRLRGSFDSQSESGFPPNVKAGKLDFDFTFLLPYRELVAAARAQPESRSSAALLEVLADKSAGLDWKWQVDLGAQSFALGLDLAARSEFKHWRDASATVGLTPLAATFDKGFPRRFLESGTLRFQLKVERLSRLQALMEQVKSGSSLALGLAGAYVVVDPKADTLSADLELKEGGIWLNGKRNASLEALLKKGS